MGASERNQEARAARQEQLSRLDAKQLVVIEECGSNIALTPLYARAPKGKRARGSAPRNGGKNTTLIAALTWSGMGGSMIIEGSANARAFEQYVEEILAPSLKAGQIVIMDNLAAHKGNKVLELIQAKGCQLLFLPGYSPDFSPLEETFSKLKTYLRRVGARMREALQEAICQALLTVTAQDAQGWFRHCGYLPADARAEWLKNSAYRCRLGNTCIFMRKIILSLANQASPKKFIPNCGMEGMRHNHGML